MAVEVGRLKKKRSANKNVLLGLIVKAKERIIAGGDSESICSDVGVYLKNIKGKEKLIAATNEEILNIIDDDKIEEDIDESTKFELAVTKGIGEIEKFLRKHEVKVKKEDTELDIRKTSYALSPKIGVKLPKICIKKFTGDPTTWQQFLETFIATVHNNSNLSDIEKFSYLKGYLGGEAEKCVEGMPLSNENYGEAMKLLEERFGNPQIMIASHMNKLLKLEKIKMGKSVKKLRTLLD